MKFVYLHGFASGPKSRKATYFKERLEQKGCSVQIPDLSDGNFRELTISGQLAMIEHICGSGEVILFGSSLGGYLAALYAAQNQNATRLVLLAPAFEFCTHYPEQLGKEKMTRWKEDGEMPVYHYAQGTEMPLNYRFVEDAMRFPPYPNFHQPAIIFHGNHDTVVPLEVSVNFVRDHANATLIRVDSGHELTEVLDQIWEYTAPFLDGEGTVQ